MPTVPIMPVGQLGQAALLVACAGAVTALLVAEHRGWAVVRAVAKLSASTAFVALALGAGALHSAWGLGLVLALVLSWVGDALLLSERSRVFLGGLIAFALAHAVYAITFWRDGVAVTAALVAALGLLPLGGLVLRWLGARVPPALRGPVRGYVGIIGVMVAMAVGHGAMHGDARVVIGALVFAASDLAVARQRFVQPAFANKAAGLPAYYAAQCLLALAVAR